MIAVMRPKHEVKTPSRSDADPGEASESAWDGMMIAAQAGQGGVYRRLLEEVAVWLRAYFANRLPASMIDDAVQEMLIALHEKRHTYDPSRPFRYWLRAIARYKWIDRLRVMAAQPDETPLVDPVAGDHAPAVMSAVVLERLLQTLKPAQAVAIRLVKLQGLTVQEAARQTGQSASLIKVNIHRGLARLTALVRGAGNASE